MHFVRKPRVNILKGRVEVPGAAAGTPRAAMNNSRGRDQLQDILDIAAGIYHFTAECSPLTKTVVSAGAMLPDGPACHHISRGATGIGRHLSHRDWDSTWSPLRTYSFPRASSGLRCLRCLPCTTWTVRRRRQSKSLTGMLYSLFYTADIRQLTWPIFYEHKILSCQMGGFWVFRQVKYVIS